jgi:FMN reductase
VTPAAEDPAGARVTLVAVVGNPKPESRTAAAATALCDRWVAAGRHGGYAVVDLGAADDGPGALELVAGASEVVLATPTYRGTFTGLLKVFLDRVPSGGLHGRYVYTLMTAASPLHALAGDGDLQRVVHELRGATPVPNIFVPESELTEGHAWADAWLDAWGWALPALPTAGGRG